LVIRAFCGGDDLEKAAAESIQRFGIAEILAGAVQEVKGGLKSLEDRGST
jgi:hypothetical protein